MSGQWPQFESDQAPDESAVAGSSSANGAFPTSAVAVSEASAEDGSAASVDETAVDAPAEATAEGEAAEVVGTAEVDAAAEGEIDAPVADADTIVADADADADAEVDAAAEGEIDTIVADADTIVADADTIVADADTIVADAIVADAIVADADAIVADADVPVAEAEPAPLDDGSAFMAELVRAMQATAGLERIRISDEAERRRQAHIDEVRAREADEAARIHELAREDLAGIEAWVDEETKRIQLEREQRVAKLDEDLETSLTLHRAKIEAEIERVEAAVSSYRAEVDAFFAGIDRETDLVPIAHQAARMPSFPALEALTPDVEPIADEAVAASDDDTPDPTGDGTAEPAVVGVMDPQASTEPAESWAAPAAEAGSQPESEAVAVEAPEPVAVAPAPAQSHGSSLFESVQVLRPMSWLRRDSNGGDQSHRDD